MSKTVRTLQVDPDGTMRVRSISTERPNEVQAAVGGYFEQITGHGWLAACNEDGKRLGLDRNPAASAMLHALGRPVGWVVGAVLFFGTSGSAEADVPDEVLDLARQIGEVTTE